LVSPDFALAFIAAARSVIEAMSVIVTTLIRPDTHITIALAIEKAVLTKHGGFLETLLSMTPERRQRPPAHERR